MDIAASVLTNIAKEERNVLETSHINGKWQFGLHIPVQQSSAWKKNKLRSGDFATFPTSKCFFLPNTNVLLHTHFFGQGSGKLSLINTEATWNFSGNLPARFTLRFCHIYFFKGRRVTADFLVSNYPMPWDRRNSAFFPKMEAALQPSSPRPQTPFEDPPASHWGEDDVGTADDKPLSFHSGRRAESSGLLFQRVKWEEI